MRDPLLRLDEVSLTYRSGPFWNRRIVRAVHGVDLDVGAGEIVGLVGESGSGKTTIGRLCLGLLAPAEGRVLFEGSPFPRGRGALRGRIGVVLQQPEWALNPRLAIGRSVAEPLSINRVAADERRRRVALNLERVGLDPGFVSRYPHELSGGQRQRVAIARALVTDPSFVVFDEAVSALDVSVQTQVLNLIKQLQSERGFSALFISHDLAATRYVSGRVAVMRHGELLETGTVDRFYRTPEHPYSRALWESVL